MKMTRAQTRRGDAGRAVFSVAGALATLAWLGAANAYAQFGPYTPDANTVALYHFDGTATDDAGMLADSSGNGNKLAANGVDPLGSSARAALGKAWDDVGGGGTLGSPGFTVGSGTNWTVEALLNIRDFVGAAPGERRDFLAFDSGARFGYRPDGLFELIVGGVSQFSTASQVETGKWIHVAVTYQAATGTTKIYKNGTDITDGAGAIPLNVGLSGNFRLGHNAGNFDQWFDEVRVSDTTRTFTPFDPTASPVPEPAAISGER